MTDDSPQHIVQRNVQPSRPRPAAMPSRGVAGRRPSGAGGLNVGDASDPGRDEEIKKAAGMIKSGLDILLSVFGDGEPVPLADMFASRAARFKDSLTDAETEVLTRYAEGEAVADIAESRGVSKRTVHNQITAGVRKLRFENRRELVGYLKGARDMAAIYLKDDNGESG